MQKKTRSLHVCLLSLFALPLLAGKLFQAGPNEEVVPGQYLVRFENSASGASILRGINSNLQFKVTDNLGTHVVQLNAATADSDLEKLVTSPSVVWVEPNRLRHVQVSAPNDPNVPNQWGLLTMEAQRAWGIAPGSYLGAGGFGASAVGSSGRLRVAVLDTGVDCTHPDFKNAGGTSVDSAQGGQLAVAASRAFIETALTSAACLWQDDHGHGTHTAGIIGAAANNGTGIAGLGYPLEVASYKVLDSHGYGDDATIASAIMAAADSGAKIISLSLGGSGYSQSMQDAVRYAWQRDVLMIAAAGNNNTTNLFYPAGSNYALGVGASDPGNAKAYFSNFGTYVGIAAPGVNILSTLPTYSTAFGTTYGSMSGTSMATPYVSALAGLVAMVTPNLGATGIVEQIQRSAMSAAPGGGWTPEFGYGIINAYQAVSNNYRGAAYGGIYGQITDTQDLPVEGATISAGGVSQVVADDGLFRLPNLPAGTYTATISAAAFPTVTRTVVVIAGADSPLTVALGDTTIGTFTGVLTNGGAPVAGAVVQAVSGGLVSAASLTDGAGKYSLAVPAGSYTLRASAPGYVTASSAAKTLGAGATVNVALQISAMGRIVGVVTDSAGSPVAGAQVAVQLGAYRSGALTDSNGAYATLGLPAGSYTVVASAPSMGASAQVIAAVQNDADSTQNFSINGTTIAVSPSVVAVGSAGTVQFTAAGSGAPATWSRTPASGTISATGLYTAPTSTAASTVTVTAAGKADATDTASSTVFVNGKITLQLGLNSLVGGNTLINCRVLLSSAAPAGGVVINLASANPAAVGPLGRVMVTAGATNTGYFTLPTNPVASSMAVTITATLGNMTSSANVTLTPAALDSVTLGSSTVMGGHSLGGNQVWITGPAPKDGAVVQLQSSDPKVTVPATVTVRNGFLGSDSFTIQTGSVTASKTVTITATYGGISKTGLITVMPTALTSFTVSPSVLGGGSTANGTVKISQAAPAGGTVILLSSENTSVITVPASVSIAAGSTTAVFPVNSSPTSFGTMVTITASLGGDTLYATLTVNPSTLKSITLSPTSVAGGVTTTANKINWDSPAPSGGAVVKLTSSKASVASVPAQIVVAEGQTVSDPFSITTSAVSTSTTITITATYGSITKTATLTVRPPALSAMSVASTAITGGKVAANNKVTLDGPAPAGGVVVKLTSSSPTVAPVPSSVTVPAGQTESAVFDIPTSFLTANVPVTITATYNGVSKTDSLTVKAVLLASITIPTATITGGNAPASSNRVALDGPAGPGGIVVTLSSSNPAAVGVPASVTVPEGQTTSPYFTITTPWVSADTVVTITASYNGTVKTDSVTVNEISIASVTVSPTSVKGGLPAGGSKITLDAPAPTGGLVVQLSSSNPKVTVPSTVTVPAGSKVSPTFSVITQTVTANLSATITATLNGNAQTATLTVTP
jgi:trimeric autotransporter adhesin